MAEEIEDLGKSEKHAPRSQIARLIEHLLKVEHASPQVRSENLRAWQISVRSARRAVGRLLQEKQSLRPELKRILAEAHLDARDEALTGLKLPDAAIPENAPSSIEVLWSDLPKGGRGGLARISP